MFKAFLTAVQGFVDEDNGCVNLVTTLALVQLQVNVNIGLLDLLSDYITALLLYSMI